MRTSLMPKHWLTSSQWRPALGRYSPTQYRASRRWPSTWAANRM
jgi:hypothetical protein